MFLDISQDIEKIIQKNILSKTFFKDKIILITGGTGFFGKWLLNFFITLNSKYSANIKIFVISRNPDQFLKDNNQDKFYDEINFIKSDLKTVNLKGKKFDYCFHMATTNAKETFQGESNLNKLDFLYASTNNLLTQLKYCNLEKILFTSSGVVYGPATEISNFNEESLSAPSMMHESSGLAEGKRLAEYLVSYYSKENKYKYSIARCFSFIGQHLPTDLHYAVGNFINDAKTKNEIIINGSGKDIRSYLYIGDAISWLISIFMNDNENSVFNVGSEKQISIYDLALLVKEICKSNAKIVVLNKEASKDNFHRKIYAPDIKKIKNKLNIHEYTSLSEGIHKMINS